MQISAEIKSAINEGKTIKKKDYMTREDFISDVVRAIETVINRALEFYGRWDDIPERDAIEIISFANPLFSKLGPWWAQAEMNIGLYNYFCDTFGGGPKAYKDYDSTMPPGYRKRISFV